METQGEPLAKIERPLSVDAIQDVAVLLHSLGRKVDRLRNDPDLAWLNTQAAMKAHGLIKHAASIMDQVQYHAMCPACGGKKCSFCMRTGWVPWWRNEEWENTQ